MLAAALKILKCMPGRADAGAPAPHGVDGRGRRGGEPFAGEHHAGGKRAQRLQQEVRCRRRDLQIMEAFHILHQIQVSTALVRLWSDSKFQIQIPISHLWRGRRWRGRQGREIDQLPLLLPVTGPRVLECKFRCH